MVIRTINPTTEEVLAEFEEFTPEQVDTVLREARESCISAKRFIVVEEVAEAFLRAFSEMIRGPDC